MPGKPQSRFSCECSVVEDGDIQRCSENFSELAPAVRQHGEEEVRPHRKARGLAIARGLVGQWLAMASDCRFISVSYVAYT